MLHVCAARVKVLEDKVPGLSAKLPPHLRKAVDAESLKNSSEQTLQERLAHLENAMAILLKNQVHPHRYTMAPFVLCQIWIVMVKVVMSGYSNVLADAQMSPARM